VPSALPIAFDRRLVLFPQGQVGGEYQRARCAELVLWCGGDVGRVIDTPVDSLDAFASFLQRIRGVKDGSEQVMVVLTNTNPLALAVVDLRRRLEFRLPALRTARWLIFVDPQTDPFFESSALRLGHLTGPMEEAPIWIGPQDSPYVVLSPRVRERRLVCQALDELDEAMLLRSGERMLAIQRPGR
jgi:hypothetical protein